MPTARRYWPLWCCHINNALSAVLPIAIQNIHGNKSMLAKGGVTRRKFMRLAIRSMGRNLCLNWPRFALALISAMREPVQIRPLLKSIPKSICCRRHGHLTYRSPATNHMGNRHECIQLTGWVRAFGLARCD